MKIIHNLIFILLLVGCQKAKPPEIYSPKPKVSSEACKDTIANFESFKRENVLSILKCLKSQNNKFDSFYNFLDQLTPKSYQILETSLNKNPNFFNEFLDVSAQMDKAGMLEPFLQRLHMILKTGIIEDFTGLLSLVIKTNGDSEIKELLKTIAQSFNDENIQGFVDLSEFISSENIQNTFKGLSELPDIYSDKNPVLNFLTDLSQTNQGRELFIYLTDPYFFKIFNGFNPEQIKEVSILFDKLSRNPKSLDNYRGFYFDSTEYITCFDGKKFDSLLDIYFKVGLERFFNPQALKDFILVEAPYILSVFQKNCPQLKKTQEYYLNAMNEMSEDGTLLGGQYIALGYLNQNRKHYVEQSLINPLFQNFVLLFENIEKINGVLPVLQVLNKTEESKINNIIKLVLPFFIDKKDLTEFNSTFALDKKQSLEKRLELKSKFNYGVIFQIVKKLNSNNQTTVNTIYSDLRKLWKQDSSGLGYLFSDISQIYKMKGATPLRGFFTTLFTEEDSIHLFSEISNSNITNLVHSFDDLLSSKEFYTLLKFMIEVRGTVNDSQGPITYKEKLSFPQFIKTDKPEKDITLFSQSKCFQLNSTIYTLGISLGLECLSELVGSEKLKEIALDFKKLNLDQKITQFIDRFLDHNLIQKLISAFSVKTNLDKGMEWLKNAIEPEFHLIESLEKYLVVFLTTSNIEKSLKGFITLNEISKHLFGSEKLKEEKLLIKINISEEVKKSIHKNSLVLVENMELEWSLDKIIKHTDLAIKKYIEHSKEYLYSDKLFIEPTESELKLKLKEIISNFSKSDSTSFSKKQVFSELISGLRVIKSWSENNQIDIYNFVTWLTTDLRTTLVYYGESEEPQIRLVTPLEQLEILASEGHMPFFSNFPGLGTDDLTVSFQLEILKSKNPLATIEARKKQLKQGIWLSDKMGDKISRNRARNIYNNTLVVEEMVGQNTIQIIQLLYWHLYQASPALYRDSTNPKNNFLSYFHSVNDLAIFSKIIPYLKTLNETTYKNKNLLKVFIDIVLGLLPENDNEQILLDKVINKYLVLNNNNLLLEAFSLFSTFKIDQNSINKETLIYFSNNQINNQKLFSLLNEEPLFFLINSILETNKLSPSLTNELKDSIVRFANLNQNDLEINFETYYDFISNESKNKELVNILFDLSKNKMLSKSLNACSESNFNGNLNLFFLNAQYFNEVH